MDIYSILRAHDGVAPRSAFLSQGITSYALGRAVHAGQVQRVRRAWYAMPDADEHVVRAVRVGGALSCITALERAGIWVRSEPTVHVAIPANGGRLRSAADTQVVFLDDPSGVSLHWTTAPGVTVRSVATIVDSLAHAALCQPEELALVAIDCALNKKLVSMGDLIRRFEALPRYARRLLARADARSQSGLETLARVRLRRLRIKVRTQVFIEGVGRVDVLVGDRLVLELDGYGFHATGESFETDRRRDLALAARGYRVIRLSYRQVMFEWNEAERVILSMVRRGEHVRPRRR